MKNDEKITLEHTEEREKDLQTICSHILNSYVEDTGDYASGGRCPYCFKPCQWDAPNLDVVEHEPNCIYLIAKDLSTGYESNYER
jgi:hypothetical protein